MASGSVRIDFSGNPAGAQKAFDKLQQQVVKLRAQMAGLATASKGGVAPLQAQKSAIAGAAQAAVGMAASYMTVFQAVRLISAEIRSLIETQRRMKEESLSLADIQISASRNLGAKTKEERDKFLEDIFAMSQETGVSEKDLTARAGAVFSARQNLSYAQAMDAVKVSARLIPESAEIGETIAVAAINMEKKTGAGAEANLGMLKGIAATAQVVNWGDIGKNVGPAVLAGMNRGMTVAEAGAFWATMTHGREDPTGKRSKTATLKQIEQLVAMFPKEDVYDWIEDPSAESGFKRQLKTKGTGLLSPDKIMAYIAAEFKAGNLMPYERYMATATFQAGSQAVMDSWLKGGQIAENYAGTKERLPTMDTAAGEFRQELGLIEEVPLQQTAAFSRAITAGVEQLETADQVAARLSIIREKYAPVLKDIGRGSMATWLNQAGAFTSGEEYRRYIEGLREEKARLEGWRENQAGMVYGVREHFWGMKPPVREGKEPTAVEASQAQVLGQLIVVMERMLKAQEEGVKEQKTTNSKLGNNRAAAAANAAMEPR